jgi:hypothetical protein
MFASTAVIWNLPDISTELYKMWLKMFSPEIEI